MTIAPTRSLQLAKFAIAGLTGGVIAAVINIILFFIGQSLNGGPLAVDGAPVPVVPLGAVLMGSLVPALVAGLVYAVLAKFTAKAQTIFSVISALIFIAFIFSPIAAATSAVVLWTLELMHIGVAVPVVLSILNAARK